MTTTESYKEARCLLSEKSFGILSTHSLDMLGYPFGSVTPYCLSQDGEPLIFISSIAQHTKNILANSKVSLTILDFKNEDDPQANARLTYLGVAEKIESNDLAFERYFRFFPSSRSYDKTHDFSLFKISCSRARYIGGFGKIFWVEPDSLVLKNPFSPESETAILSHMNKDHPNTLGKYCEKYKKLAGLNSLEMIGIDAEGFDLLHAHEKRLRFTFPRPISNSNEAREMLVEMAKLK